jgi:peptide/nickel transport system substrate-binding protein
MTRDNRQEGQYSDTPLSRRHLLQLTAGSSALALAGCSGGDDGNQNNGNQNNGNNATFVSNTPLIPKEMNFNYFAKPGINDMYVSSKIFAYDARMTHRKPTWVPFVVKNWQLNNKTFTVNLNENFTWHNGKSVTAEDYLLQFELDKYMGTGPHYEVWEYVKSMSTTGKYTLKMDLNSKVNEAILTAKAFAGTIRYTPSIYKKYVEKFKNASTEKEKNEIRADVKNITISNPIGTGPLKFVKASAQSMVLEFHDEFPWKDVQQQFTDATGVDITDWGRPNFGKIKPIYTPEYSNIQQAVAGNKLDGGYCNNLSDVISSGGSYELVKYPSLFGQGLMFNMWDRGATPGLDIWKDPYVRKAFAHAINRKAVGAQLAQTQDYSYASTVTGLLGVTEDRWLSKSFLNNLHTYDYDYKKATEYLKKAGCTKENGKWYKPNGKRFVAKFKTSTSVTRYVNALQTAVSNLSEFGIDARLRTASGTNFFSTPPNERGYQLTTTYWGGWHTDPYFGFNWMYLRNSVQTPKGKSYYLPGDEILEVPPIGKSESNKRIKIDPKAELMKLSRLTEKKPRKDIVKKLTWATNWAVPKIPCSESLSYAVISNDGWKHPPVDSVSMSFRRAYSLWWHLGIVHAES